MEEAPPQQPQYWCYHCDKRVSIETLTDLPDVICFECKNGFVESIPAAATPIPSDTQEPSMNQFLQIIRLIAEAARDDGDPPPPPPQTSSDPGDYLRIELNGWNNDEDDDDEDDFGVENNTQAENEMANVDEAPTEEQVDEDVRRARRELLRLRIRDFASRATRNRILDWSEILMGLEDHSMEFRVEMPDFDGYVGNPEDYVDAAGYEALLQNLAESDGARRGAPPASKSAILDLKTMEITAEEDGSVCAICKDILPVGETVKKLPCSHGYHGDCIVTWLGSRNTCPVCRFELPTEDPDYEDQRKKRTAAGSSFGGSSSNAGANNTNSS
ncbi:hypothetical protein ACHQM5_024653 [Ranunculus cassubicifolius]